MKLRDHESARIQKINKQTNNNNKKHLKLPGIRELEECKNGIHLSGRRDEMAEQQEGKPRSHRMRVMFNIQS